MGPPLSRLCVGLSDTSSSQTFVRRDVLDQMISAGAAIIQCVHFSFLGGIRQIFSPANFDERLLERPILPIKPAPFPPRLINTRLSRDVMAGCILTRALPPPPNLFVCLTKGFSGS